MRQSSKHPCKECRRKPNCPSVCYPKRDWERGQKKRTRKNAEKPNGTMFISGKPVADCFVYTKYVDAEVTVRETPLRGGF